MPQKPALLRRTQLATRLATIGWLVLIVPTQVSAALPGQNGLIAFQSSDGVNSDLVVINPDGTGPRTLPFAPGKAGEPSWSPDGTQIALAAGDPAGTHLWILNFLTGEATPLIQDNYVWDDEPAWSPDGSKIAFTRCGGMPISCGIWVVNADGTSPVSLSQMLGSHDLQPAWSPDGSRIAFRTVRDGNSEIYVMNSDGSGALRLTNTPEADYSPDWSPDGASIIFAALDGQQVFTIWTMNADGSNPMSLGPGEQPVYSPDGTRIAFVLTTSFNSDLWTMNADGTGSLALVATSVNELAPSWQPLSACGNGNGSGSNGHGKCKGMGNGNGNGHEKH